MNILVTGSQGFIGKNLCTALKHQEKLTLFQYDVENNEDELKHALKLADCIFHLAGVNRPENPEDFHTGNTGFIEEICDQLKVFERKPKIVLASSIQAALDNDYGVSKRNAENVLKNFSENNDASCVVYRLKNLFGKWCRPNYNSVTATFCYNIANGLPILISNTDHEIELTYIDDVVNAFLDEIDESKRGFHYKKELPSNIISLGRLADIIKSFRDMRTSLILPNFSNPFVHKLYATYLSYLQDSDFGYSLNIKTDNRGSLAEFIKSAGFGQIFISHTKPGITRGDHYHNTKTEKFMVISGEGIIRFRHIDGKNVIEYSVKGEDYCVLDIPPGYTHSIENTGKSDMVTLFWASEVFNPKHPDTYYQKVIENE